GSWGQVPPIHLGIIITPGPGLLLISGCKDTTIIVRFPQNHPTPSNPKTFGGRKNQRDIHPQSRQLLILAQNGLVFITLYN
ncbi:MAG: hypothetical protein J6X07_11750, partial [Prevotella sp.]|nr:hypothetical protein [Prevotella sp.]